MASLEWSGFSLKRNILDALESAGFSRPKLTQATMLPSFLAGVNFLSISSHSNGNTIGIIISSLQRLEMGKAKWKSQVGIGYIVLVPTQSEAIEMHQKFSHFTFNISNLHATTLNEDGSLSETPKTTNRILLGLIATATSLNRAIGKFLPSDHSYISLTIYDIGRMKDQEGQLEDVMKNLPPRKLTQISIFCFGQLTSPIKRFCINHLGDPIILDFNGGDHHHISDVNVLEDGESIPWNNFNSSPNEFQYESLSSSLTLPSSSLSICPSSHVSIRDSSELFLPCNVQLPSDFCLLSCLPADIMHLVLQFLPGSTPLTLWKCGNRRLNTTLGSTSAVERISLMCSALNSSSKYPRLLREFKYLKYLSIDLIFGILGDPYDLHKWITELSPNLEVLRIVSKGISLAILHEDSYDIYEWMSRIETSPSLLTIPKEETSNSMEPKNPRKYMDFGKYFPHIKKLELFDTKKAWDLQFYRELPDTIQEVGMQHMWTHPEMIYILPKSLTILDTQDFALTKTSICSLPPQLIELHAKIADNPTQDIFMGLPRTLESLDIHYAPVDAQIFKHLPENLKTLLLNSKYNMEACKIIPFLPPNLTRLQFLHHCNFFPESVNLLPRTLTELVIRFTSYIHTSSTQWDQNPAYKFKLEELLWPPNLSSFSMFHTDIPTSVYASFPESLTYLYHTYHGATIPIKKSLDLANLPKNLLTLTAGFDMELDYVLTSSLPRSLTSLHLFGAIRFKEKAFDGFPRGLKTLECQTAHEYSAESFRSLPPSLRELKLKNGWGDANQLFKLLPKTLTTLWMQNIATTLYTETVGALPRGLREFQVACKVLNNSIALLPPALTQLFISGHFLTGDCFKDLPRSLTHLTLPDLQNSTDDQIADLPPQLTYLSLMDCRTLSSEAAIHFPRCLTWIFDLPKNIRSKLTLWAIRTSADYYSSDDPRFMQEFYNAKRRRIGQPDIKWEHSAIK